MNAEKEFTRYEKARILGARALQIAMNAPLLLKMSQEDLEKIKFDSLKIAEIELNSDVLPISIKKPYPEKREGPLKRAAPKKIEEDEGRTAPEGEEEKEIKEEGEIMELANPEEEMEESSEESESESE
jgi:DNA-directed RNA polymerase subunit K